ncbi:hypothetical protein C4577_05475 [Candidatus Parcubacteria bacterium]|nr:MAG: hypothetical protein C4577_05475 [Candidatus Parcubacteria bacterium]
MYKFFSKNYIVVLIVLFFVSRLFFINSQPVFFDSLEYIERLNMNSLLQAMASGHMPLHSGYILIFWPIFKFGQFINTNPVQLVIIFQILLSSVTIICFYKIIESIFNKQLALKSSIIASLIPLFWITNSVIMIESSYVSFFFISLYLIIKSLRSNKKIFLLFGLISFGISFLIHIAVLLWLPLFFYLTYLSNPKNIKYQVLPYFIASFIVFNIILGYFISISTGKNLLASVFYIYTSKMNEHGNLQLDTEGIIVYLRNIVIPLLRNNTTIVFLLGSISLLITFFKNKKVFIVFLLWMLPVLITNQWWDSLLIGRHAILAGFGFALSCALLTSRTKFFYVLVLYLLIVSIPNLFLLREKIPYLEEAKTIQSLPKNGLLIESHFARPQVDKTYQGKIVFVDEPGWDKEGLGHEIKTRLRNSKPAYVSSQALSEPYGLYSGPYLHSLSLSYKKEFVLKDVIKQFSLKEYKTINKEDNLIIYEIVSNKPSEYPEIKILNDHRRRMDYYDPLIQLWLRFNLSQQLSVFLK